MSPAAPRRAFVAVVASQFFSSLADNALLIVAIGLLMERHAPDWMTPALRLVFYLAYVLLAPLAGAVSDALPKGRVMLVTNIVKLGGCLLLLAQVHPLLAYALVGLGAAAYSPAKYGILSELMPQRELVWANAWIEISTVVSILMGVALGSFLMDAAMPVPRFVGGQADNAAALLAVVYAAACICSAEIGLVAAGGGAGSLRRTRPGHLLGRFRQDVTQLWRDDMGRISLAVTCLFWGASAVLQFLVLRWAALALNMTLAQAALLQGVVALGMVGGAVLAGRRVPLSGAVSVLPTGVAIGLTVLCMPYIGALWLAVLLLLATGALSGYLVVPMNALLQHRGQARMHTGQAIAVQNFSESLSCLVLLAGYGILVALDAPLMQTVVGFGVCVSTAMAAIVLRSRHADRTPPSN